VKATAEGAGRVRNQRRRLLRSAALRPLADLLLALLKGLAVPARREREPGGPGARPGAASEAG